MSRRRLGLLLVLAAGIAGSSDAEELEASEWAAPFGQRSMYVLHTPLLDFSPAVPDPPRPGGTRWTLESGYANSFSHSWHAVLFHEFLGPPGTPFRRDEAERIHHDFPGEAAWFVDGDVLRSSLKLDAAISPTSFVSFEVPYLSHSASTADRFIENFHRTFGLSPAGRNQFPRGAFVAMLQPAGGPVTFASSASSGFGDVQGSLSWRPPASGSGRSFGVDVALKAPTGSTSGFLGSGHWDAGVLLFAARGWPKWRLEAETSFVYPSGWSAPVRIPTTSFGRVFLAATRRLGARTQVGASFTAEQSPFRFARLGAVSKTGAEFAVGVDRRFTGWSARLTLTEHLAAAGDRADVGLSLRLVCRP